MKTHFLKHTLIHLMIIMILAILSACSLTKEEKVQKTKNEKIATPIIEEYCKENYKNYKINSINGYHYTKFGSLFPEEVLTDLVSVNIKADGDSFNLYYDVNAKEFYTNQYNEKIRKETKNAFHNIIPETMFNENIEFCPVKYQDYSLSMTKIQDDSFEDVFNGEYVINVEGFYKDVNSENFTENRINSKKEFISRFKTVNLYNVLEASNSRSEMKVPDNYKDTIYISNVIYNESLTVKHYEHISIDNIVFTYCTNDIDNIKITTEINEDIKPKSGLYPDYIFKKNSKPKYIINITNKNTEDSPNIYLKLKDTSSDEYCCIVYGNGKNDMNRSSAYKKSCALYIPKDVQNIEISFWQLYKKVK